MTMSATVGVPSVTHAPSRQAGLAEKITIRDLNFFYGEDKALKSITLPLYQNKVTAFIGPSGCGKSTLLRVLNRMYDLYRTSAPPAMSCSTARIFFRPSKI